MNKKKPDEKKSEPGRLSDNAKFLVFNGQISTGGETPPLP
jgi:hypothetical protein